MKIQWSSTAVTDLESIREYIAKDSPTAARKVSKESRKQSIVSKTSRCPAADVYRERANWSSWNVLYAAYN